MCLCPLHRWRRCYDRLRHHWWVPLLVQLWTIQSVLMASFSPLSQVASFWPWLKASASFSPGGLLISSSKVCLFDISLPMPSQCSSLTCVFFPRSQSTDAPSGGSLTAASQASWQSARFRKHGRAVCQLPVIPSVCESAGMNGLREASFNFSFFIRCCASCAQHSLMVWSLSHVPAWLTLSFLVIVSLLRVKEILFKTTVVLFKLSCCKSSSVDTVLKQLFRDVAKLIIFVSLSWLSPVHTKIVHSCIYVYRANVEVEVWYYL